MEEKCRKTMLIFDGQADLTFLELKTWKSFLRSIVEANHAYFDQLSVAADILNMFCEACDTYDTTTGKTSQPAAKRLSGIVEKMAEFHKEIFGDLKRQFDPEGPNADILKSTDEAFELFKEKSAAQLREHQKLEKISEKAFKSYMRLVRDKGKLEGQLSKTLSPKQITLDRSMIKLDRKMENALSNYNVCHTKEVEHRKVLLEQTEKLRRKFVIKEKRQLSVLFSFINQILVKLQKMAPYGLDIDLEFNFDPERSRTKQLAQKSWNAYMKEHTFPEKKEGSVKPDDYRDVKDECSVSGKSSDDKNQDESVSGDRSAVSLAAPKLNKKNPGVNNNQEIVVSVEQMENSQSGQIETSCSEQACSDCARQRFPTPETSAGSIINYEQLAAVKSQACRRKKIMETRRKVERWQADIAKMSNFDSKHVIWAENVIVYALKDWEGTNSEELTIRAGDKLMQIRSVNNMGMAYGYKKTLLGLRKYGYYPADIVTPSIHDLIRE